MLNDKLSFDTAIYETLSVAAFICKPIIADDGTRDLKIVYGNHVFAKNWAEKRQENNFIGALLKADHIIDENTLAKMYDCLIRLQSITSYMVFANRHVRFEPLILNSANYIGFLIIHLNQEEVKDSRIRFLDNIRKFGGNAVLFRIHNDGHFESLYVSPEYAQMMQDSVENILTFINDTTFEETVYPDDFHLVEYMLKNHEAPDGGEYIQIRKVSTMGKIIWCNVHYAFINYLDENYMYVTYFDISTIKDSEARNAALYERARDDLESIANDSLLSLRLNLSKGIVEECRGRESYSMDKVGKKIASNIDDRLIFFPLERDRERFKKIFNSKRMMESYRNGKSLLSDIFFTQRPDGRKCFISCNVTLREDPTSGDIIAFAVEKDYNDDMVNHTILHKALVEQYDMITYIVDGKYGVVIGNAERIKKGSIFPKNRQGSYDEYIHEEVVPFVADDVKADVENDLSLAHIRQELAENDSYVKDIACNLDNEIFYKRFVFYAVNREADFYLLLKADTTAVRREEISRNDNLRAALEQARQANVAKTAFLSSMSHEIRTPMNAIIGLDNIALKEPYLPPRIKEFLEKIGNSAEHLLNLINDILDMSRIESGRMILKNEEFSFKSMLDQINTLINSQCQDKNLNYNQEGIRLTDVLMKVNENELFKNKLNNNENHDFSKLNSLQNHQFQNPKIMAKDYEDVKNPNLDMENPYKNNNMFRNKDNIHYKKESAVMKRKKHYEDIEKNIKKLSEEDFDNIF